MANGLVDYHIETPDKIKSIFEGAGISTPSYNKLKLNNQQSIDTFKKAIAKAKQSLGNDGASVELKDDYTDINLYLSEDGESGFGIKPNGDIVSVFSSENVKGRSAHMLEMAISQGGRQLDCFDIYLTKIYEAHGFKPVAKMKWNDEYIPEGWNKENFKDYNNGEPDVVFMAYDPNNDIEKQHESLEDTMEEIEKKRGYRYKRKTREEKIPYIIDYDDGEKFQHQYKWRSPAEREAIYNNMLERYKNAKTTEELKKVVFDNDKPLEVFNRQLDDLGSLSKEQAQSIRAEYSKRYLELIKDENPEEYKKNKKYLEKKYNIKSDASIYIDSLIDTIAYIDAKKKEEDAQHIYKWRSPAEIEAIYNNMLKRYKNAKTIEELKKVVFDNDKPLEVFYEQMFDLSSLSKEQVKSIEEEYSNRYLELIKEENPEEYKKKKKSWAESSYNITGDASYRDTLNEAIEYYIDKKKEFKESDVNRDADGKFAKKGSSSNKSNDETKAKLNEARRIKRYIENKFKTETMSNYEKDKWKEILKETIDEINEIKGIKTKDKKDNDKDNNKDKKDGLDYGDLPKELHEPFKRLNTVKNPSEYIINEELLEEEGMTVEDLLQDEDVFLNLSDYMDSDTNFTTSDNLQSDVESFLYDFTQNADDAKYFNWEEKWESEIHPQLKQMIKNSPIMKGKAYRAERFSKKREEIVEGGKINFDCRSVSDDNKGYEVATEFGWASVSTKKMGVRLDKLIIFEFPENTRGLNIQGCSVYPNQHEYLVDGDFIIETIKKDDRGITFIKLKQA